MHSLCWLIIIPTVLLLPFRALPSSCASSIRSSQSRIIPNKRIKGDGEWHRYYNNITLNVRKCDDTALTQLMQNSVVHSPDEEDGGSGSGNVVAANTKCIECVAVVCAALVCVVHASQTEISNIAQLFVESDKMNFQCCIGGYSGGGGKTNERTWHGEPIRKSYATLSQRWKRDGERRRIILSGEQRAHKRLHTCQWFIPYAR